MKEKILKTTIIQMIGVVMAQSLVLSYNPIGIAFFAATYILSPYRWITFPVMLISMGTVLGLVDLAKYMMIMLVIISFNGLFEFRKKKVNMYLLAALTGISVFCMEVSDTLMMSVNYQTVALEFFIGVLSAMLTIIFYKGIATIQSARKNSMLKNEEMISVAIIIGIIIYYISGFGILPAGITETFIYFAVLYAGYRYGAGMAAITGSACGIVLSIMLGNIEILGIMCALGILAGGFRSVGKIGSVTAFCCGVILAGNLFEGLGLASGDIIGLLIACIVFLILPKSIVFQQEKELVQDDGKEEYTNSENNGLNLIAESLKKLSGTFYSLPSKKTCLNNSDLDNVFEELTNNFCKCCENCNYCWKETAYNTYEETKALLKAAKNGNAISIEDIPGTFAQRCSRSNAFISEINHLFERARLNLIWYNKLIESREVVADQLNEVAVIIEDYSKNVYNFVSFDQNSINQLKQKLKSYHIILKKIVMIEKKNHIREIVITAKTERGECVTTKELANILSDILEKRFIPMKNCKKLVGNEYSTFNIIEETNFYVMHGTARKTNASEDVSGDNFAIINFGCGQMLASLSDGMGSGIYAYKDSETVIELLEQMLESGFSEEVALKLINSVMLLNSGAESPTTLDMAVVDLYSGISDFIKLGAASTFIKRGNWVEAIKSTTLPVGVINNIDIECVSKKLYNGDFIIMVSDGITDMVNGEDKERQISKIIMDIDSNNPNEIANQILSKTLDNSTDFYDDDMTVLVIGLWEKCA